MLKPYLFTLAFLLFAWTNAQEGSLVIRSTESNAQLRWFLPEGGFPDTPFVIERTNTKGEIKRFELASPMPLEDVTHLNLLTEAEYTELIQEFQPEAQPLSAEEQENRDLARAVLSLASITRPNWSRALGISYEDNDVVIGETYSYRVTTVVDGIAVLVGEEQITIGSSSLLPIPKAPQGLAHSSGISLTWPLVEDAAVIAYKVYRQNPDGQDLDLTPDGLFIGLQENAETGQLTPPEVFLQDTDVEANTSYRYVVTGIDAFGQESSRSNALEVFFPDPEPLEVPVVQAVELKDNAVELFWQVPSDERVVGLLVVRFLDPLADYEVLTPEPLSAKTSTFIDTSVNGGVSYYYALLSIDAQGKQFGPGPVWAARAINLDPPQAPEAVTISATEEQFILSWQPSSEADIVGYQVLLQRTDKPDDLVLLTEKYLRITEFIYPVPQGTINDFSFVVRAINTSYVEGLLSLPVNARLIDITAPTRPHLSEILAGEGAIKLSWAFSSDPDVAAYRVLRQAQNEASFKVIQDALSVHTTDFIDTNVTSGLVYSYSLEALDLAGNISERANPLSAIPFDSTAPAAAEDLEASYNEDNGITLNWNATESVLFYIVERSSSANGPFVQLSDILLPGSYEFIDSSGKTSHYYRLVLIDAAGNIGFPSLAVQGQ